MDQEQLAPLAESLPALVDLHARNTPTKIFIDFAAPTLDTPRISFEEFRKLNIGSACALHSLGVIEGSRIAFLSHNSLIYVLMLFGAQRIGAVPMPLNTALPIETVIALLRAGNCRALVASRGFDVAAIRQALPALLIVIMDDFSISKLLAAEHSDAGKLPVRSHAAHDIALILHTSGTLKQPKLVPLTHSNLLSNREAVRRHWSGLVSDADATLGWMPYYHVIGLAHDLMGQLYLGGRYVMAQLPAGQPVTAQVLADLLVAARPTLFYCVPWILDQMRPIIAANAALLEVLSRLKLLMSGGVALAGPLAEFFQTRRIPIVDGLGMTDTAGAILLGDPRVAQGTLRLLRGLRSELVPIEGLDAAELRFRNGPCITSGYLNDEEANAACFVGGGVFRTFDLFECINPTERIYRYCGRIDDIFALEGGEKANPLPIEQALGECSPLVQRAALLGNRRAFLIAVVEPKSDALTSMSAAEVEEALWQAIDKCNSTLPVYARIRRRALVVLPAGKVIPVTPKGSVRRRDLETMLRSQMEAIYSAANDPSQYDAIRTWFAKTAADPSRLSLRTVAEALTRVLVRLLDSPSAGQDLGVPFAALGIDSQRAVQLTAAASRTFGLDLKPTAVFQHSSPAELAAFVYRTLTSQQLQVRGAHRRLSPAPASGGSIAVTGYAMRFPGGVRDADTLWSLLNSGRDAIGPPVDRAALTDALAAKGAYTLRAGYLADDLRLFDSRVFRMSEQEASHLDPQQRLLLELTWEALERAFLGSAAARSALRIGVWVGLSSHDFELHLLQCGTVERFTATGSSAATAAGRIAYTFDLKGPCVSVDTACSSSLVATHLARQALLAGDVDVAVVGAANVLLAPEPWIAACKARLLSPAGVCRAFDAAADGYVRAEGAAVVVLRPLAKAVSAGNAVHGCLIGSAINQDGQSNGFTAPQGSAQEEVIRAALHDAAVAPTDVQVVETHGTGTPLGDPVELDALCAAYGPRPQPLALGALKSVTGHMEACAGLGGLIKTLVCMQRGSLPPHPHFTKLNAHASHPAAVAVPARVTPWPSVVGPRRAGLSSFGISGTNSHAILEEAPLSVAAPHPTDRRTHHLCALSAASPASLNALRAALAQSVALDQAPLSDVCFTLATTRAPLPYRWSASASTAAELKSHLSTPISDLRATRDRKIAFVFPGQGSLLQGLGKELWDAEPVFRAACEECDAILTPLLGYGLFERLYHSRQVVATSATLTQCTLVSIGVALHRLLDSWGVRPDVVLGHSSGELTAAHVAGLLSLREVLNFAVLRGRLMDEAAAARPGAMLAIFAPYTAVESLIRDSGQQSLLSVAAHNGPQHTVVSGAREAVERIGVLATERGLKMRELGGVATAFHSPLLDPILDQFERTVQESVRFGSLSLPLVSSATGRYADAQLMSSAAHWRAQLRGTVLFDEAVQTLHNDGVSVWVELGSRAVLLGLIRRALPAPDEALMLPCLARTDGASDSDALRSTLGALWASGVAVDWQAYHAPFAVNLALVPNLPTYCFDRKSFWFTDRNNDQHQPATQQPPPTHPVAPTADLAVRRFDADEPYALADHLVHGKAVVPGAAHLLYIAQAAAGAQHAAPRALTSVSFLQAVLVETTPYEVQYRINGSAATVETHAKEGKRTVHVECTLGPRSAPPPPPAPLDLATATPRTSDEFYAYAAERQLHCGPSFRWVQGAHTAPMSARVVLDRPGLERRAGLSAGFMDCVLQGAYFVFDEEERTALHLPVAVAEAHFTPGFQIALPAQVFVQRLAADKKAGVRVDLSVSGRDGSVAVWLRGVTFRRFVKSSFFRANATPAVYELYQELEPLAGAGAPDNAPQWRLVSLHANESPLSKLLKDRHPNTISGSDAHPRVLCIAPDLTPDASTFASELQRCALAVRDLVVRLSGEHVAAHLVLVSQSAPSVPMQALAALLRVARLEFPAVTVRHIDLAATDEPALADALVHELYAGTSERVTLGTGGRFVERLRASTHLDAPAADARLAAGTYLLTGAYGGIGRLLCAWLAERGATRILLVGRQRAPPPEPAERCAHLCDDVMQVRVEDLAAVVGIVHCAGASTDASLPRMQGSDVSHALRAKFEGAWHLHTLSARLPADQLRHFVLFSSVASALGAAGQAAYALANGALDGLAALRRTLGLPALSLNWGAWHEVGMARRLAKSATEGLHSFAPDDATSLLGAALSASAPSQLILVRAEWPATVWGKRSPDRLRALLSGSLKAPAAPSADTSLSAETKSIASSIAALVKGASQVPHADETFASLGVDSLMAIELRDALASLFGVPLPGSLVYDRPTLRLCAEHIRSLLGKSTDASPQAAPAPTPPPSGHAPADAVAIVGYACRFPGAATDLASLWQLLAAGTDAVDPAPPAGRWAAEWGARMATTRGGFLRDVELFDAPFFGISPREARLLDPQQRALLELSWQALEGAAQLPLRDPRVGVWVGVSSHDYESLVRHSGECSDPYFATGNGHSVCAGRLSYFFGLTGPSMSVDTACSSSLVGVHLARHSLLAGECSMALVGGVNLILQPELSTAFSAAGMLSPDGRCRTFDAAASGYVRSEGAAVVLLKRLADALASGDTVLAVLRGSAVNQDGRSNGLTAPSGPAQVSVIRAALSSAALSPQDVSYVEAHGTGTVLGDAVELGALTQVFVPEARPDALALGSIKSNMGHTEAAAGLAALGKVLCMLRSRQIPPHLHLTKPNAALARGLSVRSQLHAWQSRDGPLRAGVSSFGFSGTNAHVIVEEAAQSSTRNGSAVSPSPQPLLVSAHSQRSLSLAVRGLVEYLATCSSADFSAVCFTLACRRQHFPHRLAIIASDADDARSKLQAALASRPQAEPPAVPSLRLSFGALDGVSPASLPPAARRHYDTVHQLVGASDNAAQWQPFALHYAVASVFASAIKPDRIAASGLPLLAAAAAVGALKLSDALNVALGKATIPLSADSGSLPLCEGSTDADITVQALTNDDYWRSQLAGSPAPLGADHTATGATLSVGVQATSSSSSTLAVCAPGATAPLAHDLTQGLTWAWRLGRRVDWSALFPSPPRPVVDLPPYPFDRTRHWIDASPLAAPTAASHGTTDDAIVDSSDATLLLSVVLSELSQLLRMSPVPPARRLTELGFDSIMGLELIERLTRRTRRRLKLDALFAQPTAQAIAELLAVATTQAASAAPTQPPAPQSRAADAKSESFPLTPLQRSYFMAAADPSQPSCHLFVEYAFGGDVARLEEAWNRLIGRHEMLRAVFTEDAEQRILPAVPRYAFTRLASGDELAAAERRMRHQKFDPLRWPLFEIAVHASDDKNSRSGALLLISLDFLIFDLSSLALLFVEWQRFYTEPTAALPAIGASFRDFVSAISARPDPAAEAYWTSRMDDFPNGPPLPLHTSGKLSAPPVFAHLEHALSSQTWSAAQQRLRAHGLTVASALLGCYASVLNAWTPDAPYTVVATLFRPPPGSRHLIGDFSSTGLFVVDAAWRTHTLAQLLGAVQARWLADLGHSGVEGPELMQRLAKRHGRTPHMPVVFTMAVREPERQDWDAWLGERRMRVSQTPHVLLDCQAHETRAGELVVAWDYATEAFSTGMPSDMFDAFVRVITSLAAEESWASVPTLSPPTHLALYTDVNATQSDLGPAEELLHEPFYRSAAATPDAPAVLTATAELTYAQLAALASSVAASLTLSASSRVGILLPKGWQQVVAAMGILSAGMVFIPLDVYWPEERLRLVASLASLAAVVSISAHRPRWYTGSVVLIDALKQHHAAPAPARPRVSSDSEAYIIFTSGSTGQPKGVAISHRGALNTVRDVNKRFAIKASDRVFGLSELHFDLSIWDIFGSLAAGASVVIPPPEAKRDPSVWLAMAQQHGVTVWNSVPRLAELVAEEQEATPVPHNIRLIMMSGDWIPISLPAKLRRSFGNGVELISMGGATEASIWSVLYPVPQELPAAVPSVLYGRPMLNQTLHVLDASLNERPLLVPGELYIGGIGVAMCYLDAAHTARSFIVHPRLGRLYRTGDNARWHADGNMEFLGRKDTQAKIAGVRVELGEIEATALAVGGVKNAVALVKNDALVLHYVGSIEPAALRTQLGARLPAAVVPSLLLRSPSLPLTSNGKIDRAALIAASATREYTAQSAKSDAPLSAVQQQVLKEWSQLLTAPITLDSNVFAAGATSLSIIRLATRLRRALGIAASAAALLKVSTPREQAALLESAAPASSSSTFAVPTQRRSPLPASFSQQHMWFAEQLDADSRINTVALSVDVEGPLSVSGLRAALAWLVARHDALRTSLAETDDRLCLVPVTHPFDLREVSVATEAECSVAIDALVRGTHWAHAGASPFRATLFRRDDASATLLLLVHHTAFDGWSSTVLARELGVAYGAFCDHQQPALAPPAVQHADFAQWESEAIPLAAAPHVAYWRQTLGESSVRPAQLPAPAAKAPSAVKAGVVHTHLDRDIVERARAQASAASASLFSLLLSAFAALVYRRTGAREFVLGTVTPGRSASPALEEAIGCFINMVPIVCKPGAAKSFAELVAQISAAWQGALAHELPLQLLRQQLSLADAPFRVLFILQNAATMPSLRGCRTKRRDVPPAATEFDLTVSMEEVPDGGMDVALEFATTALSHPSATRLGASFVSVVQSCLSALQAPLSVLQTRSLTAVHAPHETTVLALCEEALGQPLSVDDNLVALCTTEVKRKALLDALRRAVPGLQYREVQSAQTPAGIALLLA